MKGVKKFRSLNNSDEVSVLDNTSSTDLSKLTSRSMDVIVDVHREYKETILSNRSRQKDSQKFKAFSKARSIQETKTATLQNLERSDDDIKVIDSIDLVSEFRRSPAKENYAIDVERRRNNKISSKRNDIVEEKLRSRKQWAISNEAKEEEKKPARKRWSRDTSVIRLPETKDSSWTFATPENKATLIPNSGHALSTVRSVFKQKSKDLFGIDNTGFEAENEEILRIETGSDKGSTKIEMKEMAPKLMHSETYPSGKKNLKNSSSNESSKALQDTAITIEDINDSANSDDHCNENRSKTGISYVEHFAAIDRDAESSSQRTIHTSTSKIQNSIEKNENKMSNDSSTTPSSREITAESENYSIEEASVKTGWNLLSKECRRQKKPIVNDSMCRKEDSISTADNGSISRRKKSIDTSDGDDYKEDHSRQSYNGAKSKSNLRKKNSNVAELQSQVKHKKEKKRSIIENVSSPSVPISNSNAGINSKTKKKKKARKVDIKYISVTIHRADMLVVDYVTKHPMVKVHIVKTETGKYLKNIQGTSTYLQPMITGKFDFKENMSIVPVWEEELIFEYNFDELLKTNDEQVIIFFEIVDLLSFAEASFNYDKFGHEACWYKIAWGFLKPLGRNNLHIDKMVRLQLYKPRKNSVKERYNACEVYTWWKSNIRHKYPSSLYVTVKSVEPPKFEPVFYRQLSLYDLSNIHNESQKGSTRTSDSVNLPKWTRLGAQSCKVPNDVLFETQTSENGCFYVAFSNDGKYLACSFSEERDYPIVVYEVQSKKMYVRFSGHKTFIYSINWSNNDNYLLSVSSDQTARIWDIKNQIIQNIEMMPHPSYVYCGKFYPENTAIVATGCYDRVARIWIRNRKSQNRDLSQELEGHEGFINSMCFQKNGDLLTADSVGIIIVWVARKSRRVSSKKEWHISRKIKVREINGVVINTIILHPLESRLLVHSRNSGLRMLDLATGVVLQKYNELNNRRIQLTACISPCGGLILCGGEDSSLSVWSLETGNLLAKYTFDRNYRAVTCVDYHPYDHILAFSTFGSPSAVRVLQYNKHATGEDVGLNIMSGLENTMSNNNVSLKLLNTPAMPKEKARSSNEKDVAEGVSKERTLQFSHTYDINKTKLSDSVLVQNDKYMEARLKLQQLNDAGRSLKSRSASRLYNIIEKIDRILSNTSRSWGDIESGRNFTILHGSEENRMTSLSENIGEKKTKRTKGRSRNSSLGSQSNSCFESSVTSDDKQNDVELSTLKNMKKMNCNRRKRSRSAKDISSANVHKDDISKNFSDSQMNYGRIEIYDEIAQTVSEESSQAAFVVEKKENNPTSAVSHKKSFSFKYFNKDEANSSDSGGTYILEKSEAEQSEDKKSIKVLEDNVVSLHAVKHSESESSLLSNATFTIENEVPIPKPRKWNKPTLK